METKQVIASIMGAALVAGSLFGAATVLTDQGGVQVDQVSSVETVEPSTELVELEVDGASPAGTPAMTPAHATAPAAEMSATPYPAEAAATEPARDEEDEDDEGEDDDE